MTWCPPKHVARLLVEHHYLGSIDRGAAWIDEYGAIVIAKATSRRIPAHWLELSRWCIHSPVKNAGSRQWSAFAKALRRARPDVTTVVSYSDPAQGHTGALYRACNWWWAPTWLRLRPPPSGHGAWSNNADPQGIKDRWIFALSADADRVRILTAQDEAILRRWPWARYQEPGGVSYKRFKAENHDQAADAAGDHDPMVALAQGLHP